MNDFFRSPKKPGFAALALVAMLVIAGCASLEPELPVANASLPAEWPQSAEAGTASVSDIGWREFFTDPKLEALVARALENNRDLRVAVLNIERARALYRIQDAGRTPSAGLSASASHSGGSLSTGDVYSVALGVTAFELDLFGRVNNLSETALQQYFAQEQGRRSAQLSLIAEVANVYLTLAADQELQRVAQATLANRQAALDLIQKRHALGAVSGLELSQARSAVESARADVPRYAGLIATGLNALTLLVGTPVEAALQPSRAQGDRPFDLAATGLAPLPAQLPSQVLLKRPDVVQAEHLLRAANANIGAARAAFFPSISLTGSVGLASAELSGLFGSGSGRWSFMPQLNLPIFQGDRLQANLGVATADRDIALARYERSLQNGFREVADGLALTRTLAERRQAQQDLLEVAQRTHALSQARHDAGRDSFLVLLDSQRTLYAAQQALIGAQLAEQANRVTLYKVLGGGWRERS